MQFDLHVTVDRAAVKAAALEKLWNNFYGDYPEKTNNQLGKIIFAFRGLFPKLSRMDFNMKFGGAIDEDFERGRRYLPQFHDDFRKFMGEGKILCLSEIPDNILMWSHYAEQHAGLALRIRCVPELDSVWGLAKPVRYVEQMPSLYDEEFLSNLMSGSASMDFCYAREQIEKLVYTKARCWLYEKEWRVSMGRGRTLTDREDLRFHPLELDGVIFGCKMSYNDRKEFTDLIRYQYPHAEISEAKKLDQDFNLVITSI
jgi:hypothetical protein